MRKKLFAIVMSMTMVASFMPSLAFATVPVWAAKSGAIADAWQWTPGSKTATLVHATKDGNDVDVNMEATVEYSAYTCGTTDTVNVTFTTVGQKDGSNITATYNGQSVTFPAHDFEEVAAKEASCKTAGNLAYKKCKNCDKVFKMDGTETSLGAVTLGQAHYCTADSLSTWHENAGKKTLAANAQFTCKECKRVFTNTAPSAESGDAVVDVVEAATCDKAGTNKKTWTVSVANANVKELVNGEQKAVRDTEKFIVSTSADVTVPKTIHNEVESAFVWDDNYNCVVKFDYCENCGKASKTEACTVQKGTSTATCVNPGTVTYTAKYTTKEGDVITNPVTKTQNVPALGHDYEYVPAKAATCTEDGVKEAYYKCKTCGDLVKKNEAGAYVPFSTAEDASNKISAKHVLTGTYTALTDAQKTTIKTNFASTPAGTDLLGATVAVKNLHCKNCSLEFKPSVTANVKVKVDGVEYAKVNKDKDACTDTFVLPLVLASDDATFSQADLKDTDDASKYANKAYVVECTDSASNSATSHNAVTSDEFVWNTEDPENVTCDYVSKKCNNSFKVATVDDAGVVTWTTKSCDAVTTKNPATVEAKDVVLPTCVKAGSGKYKATYKISTTNEVKATAWVDVDFAKTGHKPTAIDSVAPTVFAVGSTAGVKCANCDEILEAPKEVAKLKVGTAKISSLKAGKKSFTVKASAANATGYRVYYKKAGAKKYSYTTVKAKNLSKTVKKLSAGKKYTVKVKAYAKNYDGDGEVVWGALSSGKTVKVK